MKRFAVLSAITAAGLAMMSVQPMLSQQAPRRAPAPRPPAELLRLSIAAEKKGLAEPFKGITANGDIEPNLFTVRATGVSTEPVRTKASAFLASLTAEQRKASTFASDAIEWRKWMNQSFYVRQGVSFKDMTSAQREAAFALLRAGLSAKGLTLTRNIMRLNHTLAELNDNNFDEYGRAVGHGAVGLAARSNVVRVDRQDRTRERLLLPHSQSGHPDRVRSQPAREPAAPRRRSNAAEGRTRSHDRPNAERQRLRQGSVAAALLDAPALGTCPRLTKTRESLARV
jgi:hypothetical protein